MSEKEVRRLRDIVYEKPISDKEWANTKDTWMKPQEITWLQEMVERMGGDDSVS